MFGLVANTKTVDVIVLLTVIGSIIAIVVGTANILAYIVKLTNSINATRESLIDEIHANYEKLLELRSDLRESYLEQNSRINVTEERLKAVVANIEEIKEAVKKKIATLETDLAILKRLFEEIKGRH